MTTPRSDSSMDKVKDKQRQGAAKGARPSQEESSGKSSDGTRGGSPEQHAKAGRQSHKNS